MPKFAANITMMFNEHLFLDRIQAAQVAGFSAVECLFPYEIDANALEITLKNNNMEQAMFNFSVGDWTAGDRGLAAIPAEKEAFMQSVEQAFFYAKTIGCKNLHVMSGLLDKGACLATYKNNLAAIAPLAKNLGLTLLIEPLNNRDTPVYLITKTEEAVDIINDLGFDNVKLQFDIYHRQIMQGDVTKALQDYIPHIGHIQIAGVPNRNEPDTGELNYPMLFDEIDRLGYAGWVGCEYYPIGCTIDGLDWIKPYLENTP